MKFKKIMLISLFLLAIISISAVSAAEVDSNDVVSDSTDKTDNSVASVNDEVQKSPVEEATTATNDVAKTEATNAEPKKQASNEKNVLGGEQELDYEFDAYSQYIEFGDEIQFDVRLPGNSTSKATINFNNQNYDVNLNNIESQYYDEELGNYKTVSYRIGRLIIGTDNLNIGDYTTIFTYLGDAIYKSANKNTTIYLTPKVTYPNEQSVGEKESIKITAPKGNSGNIVLYEYDNNKKDFVQIASVPIVDGVATIALDSLSKGRHYLKINYTIGKYSDYESFNINVRDNTAGLSASVTPTVITEGNSVTLTFTGAKSTRDYIVIYVDGTFFKEVYARNGVITETISGLSVGQHKIKIGYSQTGEFYSNTFTVTVNPSPKPVTKKATKITAKKKTFKVKAKTKKYSVTLKSGKTPVKQVYVSLTVKGKTYKVKTDKKGKATFKLNKLTKKGKYTAKIVYKGNINYKKTSTSVKITIKK